MKHTAYYHNLEGEEKQRKALKDSLFYLGRKTYKIVVREIKKCKTVDQAHSLLSWVGIQGYPVIAMFNKYCKE